MENANNIFMGWKCPECSRVFSPYLHTCPYCTGEERYSRPVENKNIAVNESEEVKNGKGFDLSTEILNEWQYGPKEGGVE